MDELSILQQIKASLSGEVSDVSIDATDQGSSIDESNVEELTDNSVGEQSEPVKSDVAKVESEAKFTKRYAALQAKEKEIAVRESKVNEQLAIYKEVDELINSKNPEKLLSKLGLGVEDFLSILAGVEVKKEEVIVDPVRRDLEEIKAKLKAKEDAEENLKKSNEDEQLKKSEKVFSDFIKDVDDFIKKNQDDYEGIALHGKPEDVLELVKETYATTGKLLTMNEACNLMEEQIIENAKRYTNLKKLSLSQSNSIANKTQAKTLTSSVSNPISVDSKRHMTEDELERSVLEKIKQSFGG